jgi:hypothetical protein
LGLNDSFLNLYLMLNGTVFRIYIWGWMTLFPKFIFETEWQCHEYIFGVE